MSHSFLMSLAWSMPDPTGALLTAFGIGLVIFVHELGHFLCARAVGVDVEVFSLGFGPRLCGFVRGGCDYRISVVPLGGYVKVRGDQPGDQDPHPRSYVSKTIGQKFLVRAGGVLANLAFAVIVFPITFGVGVDMDAPILGRVAPAGPGWRAGLRPGDEVLSIDGRPIHSFTDVFLEVALGDPSGVPIVVRRGGSELEIVAKPEYSTALGTYALRVDQAVTSRIRVAPDGAAARAGLKDGESIVGIGGTKESVYFGDLLTAAGKDPVAVRVAALDGTEREVALLPDWRTDDSTRLLGIGPMTLEVVAVRNEYAAPEAPLRVGDRIVSAAGRPLYSEVDLVRALATVEPGEVLDLEVARGGEARVVSFDATARAALLDLVAFGPLSRGADSAEYGVPIVITLGSAADRAGLTSGTRLLRVDGEAVNEWSDAMGRIRGSHDDVLDLVVRQDGGERSLSLEKGALEFPDFGIAFEAAMVTRQYPWKEAFSHGLYASWNMTRQVYLTLKKMVSRDVSTENLGSIVSISVVSYHVAMEGLTKLFYFLALLSINLAVINVLPIPILDGGYMMFLLIEKVTGAPISDRVMGYSQLVGLAFIFALLIYVIKNDIQRLLT